MRFYREMHLYEMQKTAAPLRTAQLSAMIVSTAINEKIVQLKTGIEEKRKKDSNGNHDDNHAVVCKEQSSLERSPSSEQSAGEVNKILPEVSNNQTIESVIENRGTAIMDATCCPQDITYPTDLTWLSDAREKAEGLIDFLCRNRVVSIPEH